MPLYHSQVKTIRQSIELQARTNHSIQDLKSSLSLRILPKVYVHNTPVEYLLSTIFGAAMLLQLSDSLYVCLLFFLLYKGFPSHHPHTSNDVTDCGQPVEAMELLLGYLSFVGQLLIYLFSCNLLFEQEHLNNLLLLVFIEFFLFEDFTFFLFCI